MLPADPIKRRLQNQNGSCTKKDFASTESRITKRVKTCFQKKLQFFDKFIIKNVQSELYKKELGVWGLQGSCLNKEYQGLSFFY